MRNLLTAGKAVCVEGDRVRLIREDGRGEHLVELLPEERIRVELPIRASAVYRRAGS